MDTHNTTSRWTGPSLTLASLLALSTGCASKDTTQIETPSLSVEQGEAYTHEEIVSLATSLVDDLEMPADHRTRVLAKLERVLNEPSFRPQLQEEIEAMGITGVVAYRLGEGEAIATSKRGKAVGELKGSVERQRFELGGEDVGPHLAASREWGIVLVLGLPEGEEFVGSYEGLQKSDSAGWGGGTTQMSSQQGTHRLIFVGTGSGVSLDVGEAQLKITPAT